MFWRTGQREVLKGQTMEDALSRAGYGAGAIPALDFYANGNNDNYIWDDALREWITHVQWNEIQRCDDRT